MKQSKFFKNIINSGLVETDNYEKKRGIIISNYVSIFITGAILTILFMRLFFYTNPHVKVANYKFLIGAVIFIFPLFLNRLFFTTLSRIILCYAPVLFLWYVFIDALRIQNITEASEYDAMRLFLLAFSPFPYLLFDKGKIFILLLGVLPTFVSVLFFEYFMKLGHIDIETLGIIGRDYELMQMRTIVSYFVISLCCYVFLSTITKYNDINQSVVSVLKRKSYEIQIQNENLISQKHIIEEKSKSITDSIAYAKRIQKTILPKKEVIYESLKDYFIILKPKDIVSGDFYFYHQVGSLVILAAADCTGHGVPGGFMSMIFSQKLNEAVSKSSDPSEILSILNKGIKSSLVNSDVSEWSQDGMDIALCLIDIENRTIKFSGANRPIWIIRKDTEDVEVIRGTKNGIGGITPVDQEFSNHVLELNKGDLFYIFSDGYADSFSGQEKKKLTTKKFKEVLLAIKGKTIQEQEVFLNEFLKKWMGNEEQTDDILVIGVRL